MCNDHPPVPFLQIPPPQPPQFPPPTPVLPPVEGAGPFVTSMLQKVQTPCKRIALRVY